MIEKDWFEFIKAAVKNPMEVSTVFPTRPPLARRMLDFVDFSATGGKILEVGPGTGAITQFLEPRLKDHSRYLGVEINGDMADYLRERFPKLKFERGSASNLQSIAGLGVANAVVSSLPWTVFPESLQMATLRAIHDALQPGGRFITYMCMNAELYPAAWRFKALLRERFPKIEKSPMEWRNLPPATVYVSTKGAI